MTRPALNPPASPYLLLTLTALIWAGHTIVVRAVVGEIPPLGFAFWRWAVAALVLLPFGLPALWRHRAVVRRHIRLITLLSACQATGFSAFVYVGLQYTDAVNGSLLQGSLPINVVVIAWLITGATITARQSVGVATGFAGLAMIVLRGDLATAVELRLNIGDLMMWAGVACSAAFSVLLRRAPRELDATALTTVNGIIGSALLLPLYAWEWADGRPMPFDATALAAIAYVSVFSSVIAQVFWVMGVSRVGPATASYFIYLTPVFGTIMAIAILGESFGWFHAAGIALIFGGIWLATGSGTRSSRREG